VKANDITDGNDSEILLIFTIFGGPLSHQQLGEIGECQRLS